jgi:hypothetical protein
MKKSEQDGWALVESCLGTAIDEVNAAVKQLHRMGGTASGIHAVNLYEQCKILDRFHALASLKARDE